MVIQKESGGGSISLGGPKVQDIRGPPEPHITRYMGPISRGGGGGGGISLLYRYRKIRGYTVVGLIFARSLKASNSCMI